MGKDEERKVDDRRTGKRKTPGKTEAMQIIDLVAFQYLNCSKLYYSQEGHYRRCTKVTFGAGLQASFISVDVLIISKC